MSFIPPIFSAHKQEKGWKPLPVFHVFQVCLVFRVFSFSVCPPFRFVTPIQAVNMGVFVSDIQVPELVTG